MYHLLANFGEACVLCQIRDVAVHIVVQLDAMDHLRAVRFESAVEVVQVLNPRDPSSGRVKELRGDRLGERIVALLLPSAHEVVPLMDDHIVHPADLLGSVLQVGIHREDHSATSTSEATLQCW